jgi:hypothetical protein
MYIIIELKCHLEEGTWLRVLIIFGPKRDEVTGEWGKLHNEVLRDSYC